MGEANPAEWGHQFVGLTASSFNSVSLTPPLVVWSLGLKSRTLPSFQKASHYVINILSDQQLGLCNQFAFGKDNRFEGVDYELGTSGLPILQGALAWFEAWSTRGMARAQSRIAVGHLGGLRPFGLDLYAS